MPKQVWKDEFYVTAYRLAKEGHTDKAIAQTIGIGKTTFKRWQAKKPAFEQAIKSGRQGVRQRTNGHALPTFHDYIFNQLSPDLQNLWEQIKAIDRRDRPARAKMDAILEKRGKLVQQNLFIYALTTSNFSINRALSRVGVSKAKYDRWCLEPGFGRLVDEINWHKDNFFEDALIRLVATGDTTATVHVAKSRLAARGYNPTQQVDMSAVVEDKTTVDVDKLDISVDQRVKLLQALRSAQGSKTIEGAVVPK